MNQSDNQQQTDEEIWKQPKFLTCLKWKLDSSEYTITTNSNILFFFPRNISYASNRYLPGKEEDGGGVFVCIPQEAQPPSYYIDLVYITCWSVSIVALILAFIGHYSLSSKSSHDPRPLLCHMVSLLAFYALVLLYQSKSGFSRDVCYFLAVWGQYSLRAAFCWLNVVTYDMWNHFHPRRLFTSSSRTSCRKFTCQSFYAWGIPALIIGVSELLVFLPVAPVHGYKERCLVSMYGNEAQVIFFYASTSLTLVVNIVFFVLTVFNLREISVGIALANHRIHAQMLKMYMKLLGVTGICWILEVIEWAVVPFAPQPLYWIVPDILNALQGLFLFLIYNCNSATRVEIKQRIQFVRSRYNSSTSIETTL